MTKDMIEDLKKWLSENFCPIIETTGTMVCRLKFKRDKLQRDIAIAFSRYHHSADPAEYVITNAGYVLTVPSFWLGIPRELVIPYLCSFIEGYLSEYIFGANGEGNTGNDNTGNNTGNNGCSTGSGCNCGPNKPYHECPAPQKPPLNMNLCDTCENPVVGYFVTPPDASTT